MLLLAGTMYAQRPMDVLDRGLVAVKTGDGVFCSWRITGDEWYDTEYNLYRDGTKVNGSPLKVSNYTDANGTSSSTYTVRPVVKGTELSADKPVKVWAQQYLEIPMQDVMIPMTGNKRHAADHLYQLNDASAGDMDGDGEYEIVVKRDNNDWTTANDSAFTRLEAYKLDGTKLWDVDMGPNVISLGNTETDCTVADWDLDGKAEVAIRCADGTTLTDGTVIGDATKNYRTGGEWSTQGAEYLILLDGETGKLLDKIDFPLPRGNVSDWGDDYGHRCNKFFFGAPYLDGRKPSLFIGRGIYTKTICCAYDVVGKKFQKRWENLTDFTTPGTEWYGQGYHNINIADVDDDGKDEIVYGSMVIDDNGKGLNTTGLGHGDAQHTGDLDPYHKGLETFTCNETQPGLTYRDAATGKILWRATASRDVGRCMAANVSNDFDGCALLGNSQLISASTLQNQTNLGGITQNFCLYWDGDLLQETFDYAENSTTVSKNDWGTPAVFKYGQGQIFKADGTKTCNNTKGTPTMQIDILGDWRDELVLRTTNDMALRIYTTIIPTTNRIYTQLHDMQYKNAMAWQMCEYNQPPHTSYYLGEHEGILTPPPPVMTNGRTEETTTISSADDGKHVILCNMDGGNVTVSEGAKPYIVTVNSPHDYTLTGATFTGTMRLIKQGSGNLTYSGTQTYSGGTNLWDGITTFNGHLTQTNVWVNRFAELNLTGTADRTLTQEYGAIMHIAGDNTYGTSNIDTLILKKGAEIKLDMKTDGTGFDKNDVLNITGLLNVEDDAVFSFIQHNSQGSSRPTAGDYLIGSIAKLSGDISHLKVEGLGGTGATLSMAGTKLYVHVPDTRTANATITWQGAESNIWDAASAKNFRNDGSDDIFITGDAVVFDDGTTNNTVQIKGAVKPASVTFTNDEKDYTLTGDSIIGNTSLVKTGKGKLTIQNANHYSGGTDIKGGIVEVTTLANNEGTDYGALGCIKSPISIDDATLSFTGNCTLGTDINIGAGGAKINAAAGIVLMKGCAILGGNDMIKTGAGQLSIGSGNAIRRLYINSGTIYDEADAASVGDTVIFNGNGEIMKFKNSYSSYSNCSAAFMVPTGCKGTLYLDGRCAYSGELTGNGELGVYATYVRNYMNGDWSKFFGTLKAFQGSKVGTYTPLFSFTNSYGLPFATLDIQSGCTFENVDPANANKYYDGMKIGALQGKGTLGGKGTYYIGLKNTDFAYDGTIDGVNVIKTGTGTWTLTSAMKTTGDITVSQGCLRMSNATASIINSNVSCEKGGKMQFDIASNTQYGHTTINGTLQLNGTIEVKLADDYSPAVGDTFTLWAANAITGTPTLSLPDFGNRYVWDTSSLLKAKGVLKLTAGTGIASIPYNAEIRCQVISAAGITVATYDCKKSEAVKEAKLQHIASGVYMLKMVQSTVTECDKIIIK